MRQPRPKSLSPGSSPVFRKVIEEAKSESESWSLATYTAVRAATKGITKSAASNICKMLIDEICTAQNALTRFKLAQMCTILKATPGGNFIGLFNKFELVVEKMYFEIEMDSDLGKATVQLLRSLFPLDMKVRTPVTCQRAVIRSRTPAPVGGYRTIGSLM